MPADNQWDWVCMYVQVCCTSVSFSLIPWDFISLYTQIHIPKHVHTHTHTHTQKSSHNDKG